MSAARPTATAPARRRSGTTKQDIVVAAAGLFAERGYATVTVQEIGEQAGITGGAIYRHFPSKDAVLDAVLLDCVSAWVAAADFAAPSDREAEPVDRVVRASVQLVVDRPGQLATYVRERHHASKETRRELASRERALFTRWSDAILVARPELTRAEVVVRQQAANGVLSSLALRPHGLANSRLRALVTAALLATVTAGPQPEAHRPAPVRPRWKPPVLRRQEILAAAMRLFAERGYHGVGMDDIGHAARMSGPSLYEYVDGKADILLDAYDRAGALVVAGAADALAGARSAADALDRLARSYLAVAFDNVDLLVVTSREGASLPTADRPRLARRRRDLHEQWVSVLRELREELSVTDARVLVRSAFALMTALARQHRDGSPSVNAAAAIVHAFLLGGASVPTTAEELS